MLNSDRRVEHALGVGLQRERREPDRSDAPKLPGGYPGATL